MEGNRTPGYMKDSSTLNINDDFCSFVYLYPGDNLASATEDPALL